MKAKEAIKAICENKIKNLIILYGEEHYLLNEVQKKVESLVSVPEFNITYFENKPDIKDVLSACDTFPFMSDKRLVVIKNTDIVSSTSTAEYLAPLENATIIPTTILLIASSKNADKRKSFVKKVDKEGMLVDCNALQGVDLVNVAIGIAKDKSLSISKANAQLLCDMSDGEINMVANEITKLSSVCRGEISKKDIEFYAVKSTSYNIFRINDLLLIKNYKDAKIILDKMLQEDKAPMGFTAMLSNNFKQMLVARACKDVNFSYEKTVQHIIKTTGAKEYPAKKAVENCKYFTLGKIRDGVGKFAKMDFDSKQGVVDLSRDLFAILVDIYK